jgi:hypothetical protein
MPLARRNSFRRRILSLAAVFLAVWSGVAPIFVRLAQAESSIADLRSEVRRADPPSRLPAEVDREPSPRRRDEESDGWFDDESTEGNLALYELAGNCGLLILTTPLTVPKSLLEDNKAHLGRFSGHPYLENDGYMVFDGYQKDAADWSVRLTAEYGDEFSTKRWMAGRWLVEHSNRLGIDGAVTYLHEATSPTATDDFLYGDTNVTWRFAQNEWAQMRAGIGFNWLSDDFGVNFTYAGDFYPFEPFVLSGELDIGSLNHALLLHLRGTVGVQIHRCEVFTGYDYLQLDHSNVHGLVAGVRWWF